MRLRYTCITVHKTPHPTVGQPPICEATFKPVLPALSTENAAFFYNVPQGLLDIRTFVNEQFTVGKDYFIDINPAN
jgi:hypothetical protein